MASDAYAQATEGRPELELQLSDTDIAKRRRQVEAACVAGCPPFELRDAPALTKDPEDDPIVYTALLGAATCCSAPQAPAHHLDAAVGHPDSLELAGGEQPRQRAGVEPAVLRQGGAPHVQPCAARVASAFRDRHLDVE